jgi:hypothetical protein
MLLRRRQVRGGVVISQLEVARVASADVAWVSMRDENQFERGVGIPYCRNR